MRIRPDDRYSPQKTNKDHRDGLSSIPSWSFRDREISLNIISSSVKLFAFSVGRSPATICRAKSRDAFKGYSEIAFPNSLCRRLSDFLIVSCSRVTNP